jgi:hypothetical protein
MESYDVFLSYNSADLVVVQRLADRLAAHGLRPFFDRWDLVPGSPVQEAIEAAVLSSRAVAVLVGAAGLGPWHTEEMRIALDHAIRYKGDLRVIPVLLDGADPDDLPPILARRLAVDLRGRADDTATFEALVAAIRGDTSGGRVLPVLRRSARRTGSSNLPLALAAALAALAVVPLSRTAALLLLAAGASFLAWRAFRAERAEPDALTPGDLADQLAIAVRRAWEAEAQVRRLNDPHPLPVSWVAADGDLVEDWSFLVSTAMNWPGGPPSDPDGWAAEPDGLCGSDASLGEVLSRRVPTRRLVLLGEPGAGKTLLLVRLVLELLARRRSGEPVPMLVPLASWDPSVQSLHEWLIAKLPTDYPGLRESTPAVFGPVSRVQMLLEDRLLLLILDGLDEMSDPVRGRAIEHINDALRPRDGIVLSCRVEEYRRMVHPKEGPPALLRSAAGVVLRELDTEATRIYLRRDAGSAGAPRWDPVLARLGTDAPVALALRTPLMVGLARTIYNPRHGEFTGSLPNPAELCDTSRFPTPIEIEHHLFDGYVAAAYRPHPDPDSRCRWHAADAQRWLTFVAEHLEKNMGGTTDIAWWQLRTALPPPLIPLVVGILGGTAGGLSAGFGSHVGIGIGVGLGIGILLGLAIGLPIRRHARGFASGPASGLAGGLVGGLVGGLMAGLAGALGIGFAVGPTGGLGAGLGVGLGVGPASGLLGGLAGGTVGGLMAGLVAGVGVGLPSGIVNGIGVGLAAGLTATLIGRGEPARGVRWSSVGLAGGVAVGLALGLAAWIVAGPAVAFMVGIGVGIVGAVVGGLTAAAADLITIGDPRAVLRRDRRAFVAFGLSTGVATGFVSGLVTGLAATIEKGLTVTPVGLLANGIGVALGVGFAAGFTLGFIQAAWGSFVIARCWLALRRQLPWRLMSFLADAHQHHGVLRQIGAMYQFRHLGFQQRLAWVAAQ